MQTRPCAAQSYSTVIVALLQQVADMAAAYRWRWMQCPDTPSCDSFKSNHTCLLHGTLLHKAALLADNAGSKIYHTGRRQVNQP
jgi:hypothetical protein